MADKVADEKPVESTVEEVEKKEDKEVVAEKEETKAENGDAKAENGDSEDKEEPKEKKEEKEKNGDEADSADKCTIKRKSTSGDAKEAPAEGVTPEKKAKLEETTEAEVVA